MKTPSRTSTAIFTRYSWLRCMGLRVCDRNRSGSNLGRNVACLQFPKHLVNENAVKDLYCDLHQILVAAMHGVAGLRSESLGFEPRPERRLPSISQALGE